MFLAYLLPVAWQNIYYDEKDLYSHYLFLLTCFGLQAEEQDNVVRLTLKDAIRWHNTSLSMRLWL